MFEDFDEAELLKVWTHMRAERGWCEADPRLAHVVVRRLVKVSGSKGFGNARAVRNQLEEATSRAMSRPEFDASTLELLIEDVGHYFVRMEIQSYAHVATTRISRGDV